MVYFHHVSVSCAEKPLWNPSFSAMASSSPLASSPPLQSSTPPSSSRGRRRRSLPRGDSEEDQLPLLIDQVSLGTARPRPITIYNRHHMNITCEKGLGKQTCRRDCFLCPSHSIPPSLDALMMQSILKDQSIDIDMAHLIHKTSCFPIGGLRNMTDATMPCAAQPEPPPATIACLNPEVLSVSIHYYLLCKARKGKLLSFYLPPLPLLLPSMCVL